MPRLARFERKVTPEYSMRPRTDGKRHGIRRISNLDGKIEQFEDAPGADDRLADVAEESGNAIHRIHQDSPANPST